MDTAQENTKYMNLGSMSNQFIRVGLSCILMNQKLFQFQSDVDVTFLFTAGKLRRLEVEYELKCELRHIKS